MSTNKLTLSIHSFASLLFIELLLLVVRTRCGLKFGTTGGFIKLRNMSIVLSTLPSSEMARQTVYRVLRCPVSTPLIFLAPRNSNVESLTMSKKQGTSSIFTILFASTPAVLCRTTARWSSATRAISLFSWLSICPQCVIRWLTRPFLRVQQNKYLSLTLNKKIHDNLTANSYNIN